MKSRTNLLFRPIRKGLFLFIPLALLAGYSVHEALGDSGGIVGQSKEGCSIAGDACHGTQSTATAIEIYTDSTQIIAGKTYVFTISVANQSERGAGCDISVDNGAKLAVSGSGLQYYAPTDELTHTSPRTFSGDSAVWTFKYTAPKTVGVAHIYAAGNAVNLNGEADAGDHWNTTVYPVTVVSAGVESSNTVASSASIAPNPSHGRITISSPALLGPAEIEVSDAAGRTVFNETVVMGTQTPLDLSLLPNGSYFLQIRPRDGQVFTRSIVIEK